MPTTTITVASFQNALAEVADAVAASSWVAAYRWLARAEAINAGLEESVSTPGASVKRRSSLDKTLALLRAAEDASDQEADDGDRLINTVTSYPTGRR